MSKKVIREVPFSDNVMQVYYSDGTTGFRGVERPAQPIQPQPYLQMDPGLERNEPNSYVPGMEAVDVPPPIQQMDPTVLREQLKVLGSGAAISPAERALFKQIMQKKYNYGG